MIVQIETKSGGLQFVCDVRDMETRREAIILYDGNGKPLRTLKRSDEILRLTITNLHIH